MSIVRRAIFTIFFSLPFLYSYAQNCTNWLKTANSGSVHDGLTIGDLDVTGNQLTVEATFNSAAVTVTTGYNAALVSKHSTPADCNFVLRTDMAQLSTQSNGLVSIVNPCGIVANKTYHVAMVYDGTLLKFYCNGFLMVSAPQHGNMVTNDLLAFVGNKAGGITTEGTRGTINEVRIWNVARTQSQLQTYMNSSLPNPTSQTGLLAYYTFDNLLNKQGNTAWNGTLVGSAAINATNPNCTFIADSCATIPAVTACNNWLSTPANPSYVGIGDLDVPGNQLTIEANINSTAINAGGRLYAGDIVSKHTDPSNTNYLLRPNSAEITTTNGYFITPVICNINLYQTYHVAMVYDGATLKFYRDGFLMSQVAATGNLFQNNLNTRIGLLDGLVSQSEQFLGYINEVRIWNVARTQAQLRTYMNSSLPNPTTQTGLLAYYTFDNLLNKQGNTTWNGTSLGSVSLNATNPNCLFVADSCSTIINTIPSNVNTIGGIVNNYTPVLGFLPCENKITVADGSAYNINDTVLIIQMKGAIIDTSNTASFGTITNYKNAGNYEYNYVKQRMGNVIELKNSFVRQYDIPAGKVQLVRIPYYTSIAIVSQVTCLPWNGSIGGIVALNVRDTLYMGANIDASGNGFRGGTTTNVSLSTLACFQNGYFYDSTSTVAAHKGEGIASVNPNKQDGRGNLANGGGGGNGHNSGGGGGGNGTAGGFGGYQLYECNNTFFDNRGIGGIQLPYNNTLNKIYLGGGGGAGHSDALNPNTASSNGGNGGGIILLNANYLQPSTNSIISNGLDGQTCTQHDGMGGGGSGGTILLNVNNYINNSTVIAKGGKGADLTLFTAAAGHVGPGGGGSGGVIWLNTNAVPTGMAVQNVAGSNGVINLDANNSYGATTGGMGINLFNLKSAIATTPFKKGLDSVRFTSAPITCSNFNFVGLAYPSNVSINLWQWAFGDGGFGSTQNIGHNYAIAGNNIVKLIVTDVSGCSDSTSATIQAVIVIADAGNDSTICHDIKTQLNGTETGGTTFAWTPARYLNDSTLLNPTANIVTDTKFYLSIKNAQGCAATDSVTIKVKTIPLFSVSANASVCTNASAQLSASGGNFYRWSPTSRLSNPLINNPIASPAQTTTYTVFIKETTCNDTATLFTTVSVLPNPTIVAFSANDIDCTIGQSQLIATGALQYVWSPANGLNNTTIYNPIAAPTTTTTYMATGKDQHGCTDSSSVTVIVSQNNKSGYYMPNAFTPNGDGLNDCFGIKYWGQINAVQFIVYDRYGKKMYYTENPSGCWDGTLNGQPQPAGNYIYYIKAMTVCGTAERKGSVVLIR